MKQVFVLMVAVMMVGSPAFADFHYFANEPRQSDQHDGKQDDGKQDDGKQDDGKQDDGKQDDGKQDGGYQDGGKNGDHKRANWHHRHRKGKGGQENGEHQDGGQDGQDLATAFFHVACYYTGDESVPPTYRACKVNAEFEKVVTLDGGEVADESPAPTLPLSAQVPVFNVECDNNSLWKDHGRRFTDLLSTRIQAVTGPLPAIYLPRGALHVGPHVSDSYLEIDTGIGHNKRIRLAGKCHIWTAAQ